MDLGFDRFKKTIFDRHDGGKDVARLAFDGDEDKLNERVGIFVAAPKMVEALAGAIAVLEEEYGFQYCLGIPEYIQICQAYELATGRQLRLTTENLLHAGMPGQNRKKKREDAPCGK